MACCGPSIQRIDEKTLFEKLRKNEETISLKLGKSNMNFLPIIASWKSN